mgnify:CR=1 FL=1
MCAASRALVLLLVCAPGDSCPCTFYRCPPRVPLSVAAGCQRGWPQPPPAPRACAPRASQRTRPFPRRCPHLLAIHEPRHRARARACGSVPARLVLGRRAAPAPARLHAGPPVHCRRPAQSRARTSSRASNASSSRAVRYWASNSCAGPGPLAGYSACGGRRKGIIGSSWARHPSASLPNASSTGPVVAIWVR